MGNAIDNQSLVSLSADVFLSGLLGDQVPKLVKIDGWAVLSVLVESENSDSFLTEISWMVFEHVDSLVVLASGHTSTGVMFSVLANSTVSHGYVSS